MVVCTCSFNLRILFVGEKWVVSWSFGCWGWLVQINGCILKCIITIIIFAITLELLFTQTVNKILSTVGFMTIVIYICLLAWAKNTPKVVSHIVKGTP